MENFNYVRPGKVSDAVKAMMKAKDGKYMSGGMTLLPALKQGLASPTDIVDLGGRAKLDLTTLVPSNQIHDRFDCRVATTDHQYLFHIFDAAVSKFPESCVWMCRNKLSKPL